MPHTIAPIRSHGKSAFAERAETIARAPPGEKPYNLPSYTDEHTQWVEPPMQVVIEVQGKDFAFTAPKTAQIARAINMAHKYGTCLFRGEVPTAVITELTSALTRLQIQFSRQEAERAALADADGFEFTPVQLQRDIGELRRLGTLTELIHHYNNKQKESGLNEDRIRNHLSNDIEFPKIMDIVANGAVAETDPAFVRTERLVPLRDLQRRLQPVYMKHAATMHAANRVLVLPIDQLTDAERKEIHMANEFHWRPEPGKVAGRPLMDCSNATAGAVPLNTDITKQQGVQRYQQVTLPTLRAVITSWDEYRRARKLEWKDMWMFKADISNCFNQLHWAPNTAKLMGFMLTATLLMLMLTCGFGVAITPMVWGVIGDALNRKVNESAPAYTFTYVDDFFGAGTHEDTTQTQTIVHRVITDVLGPEGLSVKKNVHAQTAEILGILVDLPTASMRPKDKAIEKLFYVLFSIDASKAQPMRYWQCLASLVNLYSQVIHGMRPFVAPITHMTYKLEDGRPRRANANAQFAIEIWRAVIVVAYIQPNEVAVPIPEYLGAPSDVVSHQVVSDASPWRLCAALYHPQTKDLLAWTTYRLPYGKDIRAQFQCQREYLGHVLSSILVAQYRQKARHTGPFYYQWINDNTGALQWAASHKCDSEASQYACLAITQIHMSSKIVVVDPTHKAGADMGDIDTMSRIMDDETPTSTAVRQRCQTLHPEYYWPCQHLLELDTLFRILDPAITRSHNADHHSAYMYVHTSVTNLLTALQ